MGATYFKKPRRQGLPAKVQLKKILDLFPDAEIVSQDINSFEVILKLQPTPISEVYELKFVYSKKSKIEVFVINKKLKIAKNRSSLPHVYSTPNQELCLFTPKFKEWAPNQIIANTIIPWAIEWLDFYEHWLIDGEWLGGGHDEYLAETKNKNEE